MSSRLVHSVSFRTLTFSRNEVIRHIDSIDQIASHTTTRIPVQVLADVDGSRNPLQLTRDRLERAATENQFMNGKIAALTVCVVTILQLNV